MKVSFVFTLLLLKVLGQASTGLAQSAGTFTPTGDMMVGISHAMYDKPFKPHLPFAHSSLGNGMIPIENVLIDSTSVAEVHAKQIGRAHV